MSRTQPPSLNAVLRSMVTADESDEVLLTRFVTDPTDASFQAIVRRHGGLVWSVCRSVLGNEADAEDAFQATFLTLVTHARTVRAPAALAAWLHGTACRVARKARAAAARRREVESRTPARNEVLPSDPSWAEVQEAIHQEVNRLPDRERVAVVLCYLTGATQDAAAAVLGLTRDGVKKRLERGREMLRAALTSRGFGPVAVLAAMVALPAAAPAALVKATTGLAIGVSTGTIATRVMSTTIRSLTGGATKMVSTSKLMAVMAVIAALTALGFGMSEANTPPGQKGAMAPPDGTEAPLPEPAKPAAAQPPTVVPAPRVDLKDDEFVWGKEVDGLQAGVVLRSGGKAAVRIGSTATVAVRIRNVSKEAVKVAAPPLYITAPSVTDAAGKKAPVLSPAAAHLKGLVPVTDHIINPGRSVDLDPEGVTVIDAPEPDYRPEAITNAFRVFTKPGKYEIRFERFLQSHPKLATGACPFTVTEQEASAPEKGADLTGAVTTTIKDATLTEVDEASGTISLSFGTKDKPTKLVNVPLADGVRVVASHVLPGSVNNLPFEWKYAERLKGKVVSIRVTTSATGMSVVSIASGND